MATKQQKADKRRQALIEESKRVGIPVKDLTIDFLKSSDNAFIIAPDEELFIEGVMVDMQSRNLMCTIYDSLSAEHKAKFNSVLQDKWKLARFMGTMWDLVKTK